MIGIIGGSGLYKMGNLEQAEEQLVKTPFGDPSAAITRGVWNGQPVAFIPRHGVGHGLLPSEVNYRANLWALKSIGVRRVISVSAVGSLAEETAPGDVALVRQYFDWTRGVRKGSFFGGGVIAHVSTAQPVCADLEQALHATSAGHIPKLHRGAVYGCVEGPRFGTQAESHFLRKAGCTLVGMTNVPEAFLAREAQLCYATIAVVTDYDCWMEDTTAHPTTEQMFAIYGANLQRVIAWLQRAVVAAATAPSCQCRRALAGAIVTPKEHWPETTRSALEVLLR